MTVAGTKQASGKGATTTAEERAKAAREDRPEHAAHDRDLLAFDTPVMSLRIHRPHLRLPRLSTEPAERAARAARAALPPPARLAYYGGLGAAAALGAIEWPVAVAIGVGTAIGQRMRRGGERTERARATADRPAAPPPPDPTAKQETAESSRRRRSGKGGAAGEEGQG